VTAIRAAAEVCRARVHGDYLGSLAVEFAPTTAACPGAYRFDLDSARPGGSAGATSLVLQTVLPTLVTADGASTVIVRGGTHVAWSPPFDYLRDVWLTALAAIGLRATATLRAWGWYPAGQGEIAATVEGLGPRWRHGLTSLTVLEPGPLQGISGRAVVADLPLGIAQRMARRATQALGEADRPACIEAEAVPSASPGAGVFLTARYAHVCCGFSALGARGKRAETVADEAVAALLRHAGTGCALDRHLADQILLPLALAPGPSRFTTESVTQHLRTNAWLVEQFGGACVEIDGKMDGPGEVRITPAVVP
jgi:RNA 3'-terminal phosphate cyclase (ATP)